MAPAALYRGAWAVSACLLACFSLGNRSPAPSLHAPRLAPEDDQGNSAPPTGKMLLERRTSGRAGGRSRRKKPLATPSGALATPLAGRGGATAPFVGYKEGAG